MSNNPEIGGAEVLSNPETIRVQFIGRLGDLNLGNPEGIPTDLLTDEAIQEVAERLPHVLAPVTDKLHYGCIDGRCVLCNKDGSVPQVRHRQVGGTGAAVETAVYGDAPVLKAQPEVFSSQGVMTNTVHDHLGATIGILPSAHEGGCGGVNGAQADAEAVSDNDDIAKAAEAVMAAPGIQAATKTTFDQGAMNRVRGRAGKLAEWMKDNWSGPKFVEAVGNEEPAGVEVLQTAEDAFGGHRERGILLVVSKDQAVSEKLLAELDMGDFFVWSLTASCDMARATGGQRGQQGYQESLLGNMAKHLATAHRLASRETPVFVIFADDLALAA